jgi:hypothetical protein
MRADASPFCRLFHPRNWLRILFWLVILSLPFFIALGLGKLYQHWDDDPDRGAVAIENGAFGENYSTPIYLDQGWAPSDSLWYYTTTQGSALMPYDLFLALEQANSTELFRANNNIDKYRYLPQKPTFFNPDGLPVGFTKEPYQGMDYVGYTCAACHTGQVNYQGKAIRIDGGSSMADMVGFLTNLEASMKATLTEPEKTNRFVKRVMEIDNDYSSAPQITRDLQKWTKTIELYNNVNHSHIDYGYARLDAFGRIYNRVLEHVISRAQVRDVLLASENANEQPLLNSAQVDKVLDGINETIIGDLQFALIIERLISKADGYPGLSPKSLQKIKRRIFNEPNAPVSYPFLWDIVQSDYVQWNGLASNADVGPLGRNAGEVLGVFGKLDWTAGETGWSLSSTLTGQQGKSHKIDFKSSIDLVNLSRLESQLKTLTSPKWPEDILGKIDRVKAARGRHVYAEYCESCHEVIDPTDWDRIVVANMSALDVVGTDRAMAENSVNYSGYSGNFKNTYQKESVGSLIIKDRAPVVQILTAATMGTVGTADADKWFVRRGLDWVYMLAKSFFDNDIKPSVKAGNYQPDTTAQPYRSLLSYKARSLNGIWATGPFLHNGSVPTIYDLLLPMKRAGDPETGEYRPAEFKVGSRELDPVKIGFKSEGYDGFTFTTQRRGDMNMGHEYGSIHDPSLKAGEKDELTEEERWELIEYIKTL